MVTACMWCHSIRSSRPCARPVGTCSRNTRRPRSEVSPSTSPNAEGATMTKFEINQFFSSDIADADPAIAAVIAGELGRQRDEIELIASENIVSHAVLQAQGSVLTNKYAEGYPGRRYYGGCQFVDIAEEIAIARARELFGCAF